MEFRIGKYILLAPLLLLSGCGTAAKIVKVEPPAPPRVTIPEVEPQFLPLPNRLPQISNPLSSVDIAILQAQATLEYGEDLYRQGFLDRAKAEFDSSIDTLLEASRNDPERRLAGELDFLVERIHVLEMAALKEGDGFIDQNSEPAAIDDLEYVETFPAEIDLELKAKLAEDITASSYDLPVVMNERVLGFVDHFTEGRGRKTLELGLERIGHYREMIERVFAEEGLPLDLIYLAQAESSFSPIALSRAKAKGMWQFISSRGKEYGLRQNWWIDERSDPEKSTRAAARHLKDLYGEFGDWYLAMAAYNAGPLRVQKAVEMTGHWDFWELARRRTLPVETVNYVPTILALTIVGRNPEHYGFSVEAAPTLDVERIKVDKPTDLRIVAEAIEVPVDELRRLNPHVLRMVTPADDADFELSLPSGTADRFLEKVASLPDSERVRWRYHTVTPGETLARIARKYGVSSQQIAQANNATTRKVLRPGESLLIPVGGGPVVQTAKAKIPSSKPGEKTVYRVRRGDTLSRIAVNFGTTISALRSWNPQDLSVLRPGDRITIYQK